jgi:hypothetical protein
LLLAECCLVLCELPDLLLQINNCTLLLCRHGDSVVDSATIGAHLQHAATFN